MMRLTTAGLTVRQNLIDAALTDRGFLDDFLAAEVPAGATPWRGGTLFPDPEGGSVFMYLFEARPQALPADADFPADSAAVHSLAALCGALRAQFDLWLRPAQAVALPPDPDQSDDGVSTVSEFMWTLPGQELVLYAGRRTDDSVWITLSKA